MHIYIKCQTFCIYQTVHLRFCHFKEHWDAHRSAQLFVVVAVASVFWQTVTVIIKTSEPFQMGSGVFAGAVGHVCRHASCTEGGQSRSYVRHAAELRWPHFARSGTKPGQNRPTGVDRRKRPQAEDNVSVTEWLQTVGLNSTTHQD